jgi:hypothetical protein
MHLIACGVVPLVFIINPLASQQSYRFNARDATIWWTSISRLVTLIPLLKSGDATRKLCPCNCSPVATLLCLIPCKSGAIKLVWPPFCTPSLSCLPARFALLQSAMQLFNVFKSTEAISAPSRHDLQSRPFFLKWNLGQIFSVWFV